MLITHESHLDHGLTGDQIAYILRRFRDETEFFNSTFELPETLGTVPCRLYGPTMGDAPVPEAEVVYEPRGDRSYPSRLVARPERRTRTVTVIAGPHGVFSCVLYTAFGGPSAPREPADPAAQGCEASAVFWRDHALAK